MNSCFNHSPFCYSHFLPATPTRCSSRSPFLFRNARIQRNPRTARAYVRQENLMDKRFCARRVIVFMGFAEIPILKKRADAVQALNADNTELKAQDQKEKEKESVQESSSRNSYSPLLNAIGFLVPVMLAALYASTKKEKDAADATIESMKIKLDEKDAAIASLEEKIEIELFNEKENGKKAIAKANEAHLALSSQFKLSNDIIKGLDNELQEQIKLVEELTFRASDLEASLRGAHNTNAEIQKQLKEKVNSLSDLQERVESLSLMVKGKEDELCVLNLKFTEKERELDRLNSVYKQSEDRVANLNSEIRKLKDLLLENEEELELKNGLVEKLKVELSCLIDEKNKSSKKYDAVVDEYNNFRLLTEKKSASDAEIFEAKEEKIHHLEEQIKCSSDEIAKMDGLVSDLIKDNDNFQKTLEIELQNAKNLGLELEITGVALEKSRKEVSDLSEELKQSRYLHSEIEKEVSKAQTEFNEAKETLQTNILEMKQETEILSGQLRFTKELLDKSNGEIEITSQKLLDSQQKYEILEKELVQAHEKAESAILDLNEEKKTTTSLSKELKLLEAQVSEDREFKKNLESDLDEASKALDEMNRNSLILSRELEIANSRISDLEAEKETVFNDLDKEKWASREARKNLDDAHGLVMRLGKEREGLEKRGRKLEEELASAKGEILRLRGEMNSFKITDNVQSSEKNDGAGENGVQTKRVRRRRKVKPKKEDEL